MQGMGCVTTSTSTPTSPRRTTQNFQVYLATMNSLDVYDFDDQVTAAPSASGPTSPSAAGTAGTSTSPTSSPTFNEEVQQVMGTLGGFWGSFRKQVYSRWPKSGKDIEPLPQGVAALQTARKDLASVAQQAQQELGKLQQRPSTDSTVPSPDPSAAPTPDDPETSETPANTSQASDATASPRQSTSTNIFSFLPIPPTQIAETVQKTFSEGSANIQSTFQRTLSDPQVQQLKSTLSANLHTLQENVHHIQENVVTGVHHLQGNLPDLQNPEARDKLLGDARKQGGDWLKQAGEFFQDAVKVVPPAPGQAGYQPGMIWDGSDVWMFSEAREEEAASAAAAAAAGQKGKGKEGISVSRTGALLRKLRTDPEMIRAVPSGETYEWFCEEINAKDGGLGGDEWKKKCEEVEKLDGLKVLRESLVPSELDEETFWRRYWFRAWQIQQEEEKRKALLQGIVGISSSLSSLRDNGLTLS